MYTYFLLVLKNFYILDRYDYIRNTHFLYTNIIYIHTYIQFYKQDIQHNKNNQNPILKFI